MRHIPAITGTILLVALSALTGVPAAQAAGGEELVRRMVDSINSREFDALDGIIAPGLHRHSASTPGVKVESREDFVRFLHQDLQAVPDARMEIDFLFGCGDRVAGRFIYRGTQKGAWGPFPPSHRKVEIPFLSILRIEEGRIAEIWVEWDNMNALTQLGHFTAPGEPASPGTRP